MIIALSGKIDSGKDTVAKICQVLIDSPHFTNEAVFNYLDKEIAKSSFENKKFADSLKDIVCILLGCTRAQLEDKVFKETFLGEEWWCYKIGNGINTKLLPRGYYPNQIDNDICEARYLIKLTPRLLLQLVGTECGRNIIHPNIWVNSLMNKYVPDCEKYDSKIIQSNNFAQSICKNCICLPNWIISDMRFPNELKAVQNKGGITIRIERTLSETKDDSVMSFSLALMAKAFKEKTKIFHPSETALDDAKLNYTIYNNGTLLNLIQAVREILKKEKLI
jgi:hypothetical protein